MWGLSMKDQKIKDMVGGVKTYFVEMPKKRRNILLGVLCAVIAVAAAITVALNANASQYRVLYSGMEQSEASNVYQLLREQGVAVQINPMGEITVPANRYDELLLNLAAQGYPKSALTYDVFSSHTGLTTTESEKKQWLIYQLQERIQQTLQRISEVQTATVTINIPETSDYVWQQTEEKERAQASVLLSLKSQNSLGADQVNAICKLVAAGCPQMQPEDVTVVDAATSLELSSSGSADSMGLSSTQNLELESLAQERLEENILRILEPRYGKGGVVAAARVTLNYNKMITEQKTLQEKPDGGGNVTHTEGNYSLNGEETVGGIVGETNNDDIPGYGYDNAAGREGVTDYNWSTDYDYSYIKTQIEKGNATMDRVTVSVMVNEPNLTQALRTELIGLVSTGADIPVAQISVSSFTAPQTEQPTAPQEQPGDIVSMLSRLPWWLWLAIGAGFVLIIVTLVTIIIMRKKAKKTALEEKRRLEQEAIQKAKDEITEYKKQLSDAAKGETSDVDEAIMAEVKDFAKQNPEVTANLLRSWLRE